MTSPRRPGALGPRRRPVARAWSLAPLGRPGAAQTVAMPCQWQSVAAFAADEGPFVYTAGFTPPPWRRVHLVAEGTFYHAQWRLNGDLLGVHSGAWDEARFDLTDRLRPGENHLEAVVSCPPERGRRRLPIGVFGGWDCLPPDFRPGGMWRPVYLEAAGDVRIEALWLSCERLARDRADVVVHARVEARLAVRCDVALRLAPPPGRGGRAERARLGVALAPGRSLLALPLTLERPLPWEPWLRSGRDEADLYDLALRIVPTDGPSPAARRSARVGLRTLARDRAGRIVVNGRPLFVKGWNYGPSAAHLAEASPARIAADVRAARERGLDALRVHAHLDHPALYRAADRLGVLLFQDGPLQWVYVPEAFPEAAVQLRAVADRLSAHPSVVELRAHNEPVDAGTSGESAGREPAFRAVAAVWQTFAWSEDRDVWDRALAAAMSWDRGHGLVNGTMLFAPHSGVIARGAGQDTHLYAGWYPEFGSMAALDAYLALFPWATRWLSEFGAQSLPAPETARAFVPARPLARDWLELARRHMAQPFLLERAVGIEGLDRDTLVARTQAYQEAVHAAYIDRVRVRRGRGAAGFFGFLWADAADGVTWSLLDRERRPKAAYTALRAQLQPLAAALLLPVSAPRAARGRAVRVPLWLVNDTLWRADVHVSARLGGEERLSRNIAVEAESAVRVGDVLLERRELLAPGMLHLAWQARPLSGRGTAPADGERSYALPSPLWRHWPAPSPVGGELAVAGVAGAAPGAPNEP